MTRPKWTHWACTCGARGEFRWADIKTKTDVTADAKHQKTCRGSVTTSTRADLAGQIATSIGRLA